MTYIWEGPPMAERRLGVLWLLLRVGFVLFSAITSVRGARTFSEPHQAVTSPPEATSLRNLRNCLGLSDQEWPESSDPCASWNGVQCENGHVVEVTLAGLATAHPPTTATQSPLFALQQLPLLRFLNASGFSLFGTLPIWLEGLQSLEVMDFMSASLSGSIPSSVGQLPNLKILQLANNSLTGSIPSSIGNLTSLTLLDLSNNQLQGRVPESLGNLQELKILNLSVNRLQGNLPVQLGGLSALQQIFVSRNNLGGFIPPQLGSLSLLNHLDLSSNSISGSIPVELSTLTLLTILDLSSNFLTGRIPADLGKLKYLTVLNLGKNQLAGVVPPEVANCTRLEHLILHHNLLTGALPESIGNLQSMVSLDVSWNNLSGEVPPEISDMMGVESVILADNSLSGRLPKGLSLFKSLLVMDLSGNYFSGPLLKASRNSHDSDSGAVVLIDRNCFSPSPSASQRPPVDCSGVNVVNLGTMVSFPGLVRQRMMAQIVTIPSSPRRSWWRRNRKHLIAILAGVFASLLLIFLVAFLVFYILQYERKAELRRAAKRAAAIQRAAENNALARSALNIPSGRNINIDRLGDAFPYNELLNATGQFDLSNMIMAGHTGDLYKGVLNRIAHVVVKRVDVRRFKKDLYMFELEFFGRVAHLRFVPLLGHCLEKEEEKLLVYKYMPNGDLAYALHRKESPSRPEDVLQSLDWITRLKVAIGAAEGLVYLHHECSPPLVHRDIKASSILLDDKFEVRLGSLSEARVQQGEHHSSILGRFLRLSRSSDQLDTGQPVASCSYDVFCFGKVLLELVSGKLGISGSIDPAADVWLEWALPLIDIHDREPLLKLMDPSLIVDEDLMEEVWATAIIAKSCLNPKPSRRPNMKHILRALENPQKVVRDDNSGPLKSRHSSYGSWNAALFGAWRHFSSENAFGLGSSLREEHSSDFNNNRYGLGLAGPGNDSARIQRRVGSSREIVPIPLSIPTAPTNSDESDSRL